MLQPQINSRREPIYSEQQIKHCNECTLWRLQTKACGLPYGSLITPASTGIKSVMSSGRYGCVIAYQVTVPITDFVPVETEEINEVYDI